MKPIKYLLLSVVLLASACREEAPELMNPNEGKLLNTPSQVFETFWHGMNNCYVFWDIDPTDWDKVYDDYLPRFRALDALETVENATLKKLYTEICKELVDHHYAATITNTRAPANAETAEFTIYPWLERLKERDYYHEFFSIEALWVCQEKLLTDGRIADFSEGYYTDAYYACSYNIDNGIIYLYFTQFVISEAAVRDPDGSFMRTVENYMRLIHETPDIRGVILDVRGNPGGIEADLQYVLAPLIDTELPIFYTRTKTGPGRLDYGPWVLSKLAPAAEHRKIEAPVVVLTDVNSASMSEITSMAVAGLPNGCIIGERTGGATGPLSDDFSFSYTGSFANPCVKISTSTAMGKCCDGVIYEDAGFPPDIEVLYDEAAMLTGRDPQFDRAVAYIHTGK